MQLVETHLAWPEQSPMLSAHCVESAAGSLSLSVTYAPVFHAEETVMFIVERFQVSNSGSWLACWLLAC